MESETHAILRARTERLARPAAESAPKADATSFVVARAGELRVALETPWVLAAVTVTRLGVLPGVSPSTLGLLHFRGSPIVAFHPAVVLNRARHGLAERTQALVLGTNQADAAFLVDAVEHIRQIQTLEMLPAPEDLPSKVRGMLHGVTEDGVLVLDLDALMGSEQLLAKSYLRRRT